MGKSLYLECYAGVSGRMIVEALLELGADRAVLDQALNRFYREKIGAFGSSFYYRRNRYDKSGERDSETHF